MFACPTCSHEFVDHECPEPLRARAEIAEAELVAIADILDPKQCFAHNHRLSDLVLEERKRLFSLIPKLEKVEAELAKSKAREAALAQAVGNSLCMLAEGPDLVVEGLLSSVDWRQGLIHDLLAALDLARKMSANE